MSSSRLLSRLSLAFGTAGVGFLVLGLHGCGGSTPSGFGNDDGGLDGPGQDDSPFNFGDSGGDGGVNCPARCSSDLHTVIDCNGNVLSTCPDTQGCDPSNGQCIAACDSAKANKGSIGCDFYGVAPTQGSCFAIFVANTWNSPVTITGDYAGAPLNVANIGRIPSGNGAAITYAPLPGGQIPAGQVAILFVGGSGCPIAAGSAPSAVTATSIGSAVHIAADRPVSAYDIFPYGGGTSAITSASLLLPTSAWDTNYVAVSPFDVSTVTNAPAGVHLVAAEDNTQITILPKKAITGGSGVAAAAANVPKTYTINKGQQLVFMQTQLLDGSPIQSTKPIGMWASMNCFNVPASTPYCDSAHQQVPPVQALGSEYALVRYRNRKNGGPEETPPWRLLGLVDGTTLTWEPSTPPGAPTTLAAGQLANFTGSGPYTVRSQDEKHPFYVSAHMSGCSTVGSINTAPDGCIGDAEYVNVVPAQEFQNSYVFFTDPTYPETDLVMVRAKAGDNTFKDVKLDCAGNLTGWKPLGTTGDYEYTNVDLIRGGTKNGTCDNGPHSAESANPFTIMVWGLDSASSYAYPAGGNVAPINTVIVPPTPN